MKRIASKFFIQTDIVQVGEKSEVEEKNGIKERNKTF